MSSTENAARHLVIRDALRHLATAAQSACAREPADSPARQFYLGVQAAAKDALHPELADAKPADWRERESPSFREGYARASLLVSGAWSADVPSAALPLPEFTPAA